MAATSEPPVAAIGIHHHGVVVSDLERSIDFYRTTFGAEPLLQLEGLTGPQLAELYESDEVEFSIAMMAFPSGSVELIQFHKPDAADGPTSLGATHFAIEVEDVEASIAVLAERGIEIVGSPLRIDEGPSAGTVLAYAKDLDGHRFELVQLPAAPG